MYKKENTQNGITLIALVITIIVMLILVAVAISMAVNGGLFEKAGEAVSKTNVAMESEKGLSNGDIIDEYLNKYNSGNQPNAQIQMVYELSMTEPTRGEVTITINPRHKEYIDYQTWGTNILNELAETKSGEDLKVAKEALLLEGINYWDIKEEWWTGEGFDSLQDFTDYVNDVDGTDYANIYEWMLDNQGGEEETVIDNFMLYYGDIYIKPEQYCSKNFITVIKPDNTEEKIWPGSSFSYTTTTNGNYTFEAKNENGDIGFITVKVDNIIVEKYTNIYSETKLYTDKNGKTAWIPKGFAVGTDKSKNIEIDEIENGLVITDAVDDEGNSIGNEFVWVPVDIKGTTQEEKEASFEKIRTEGYYDGSLQSLLSSGKIKEPYYSWDYSTEEEEYNLLRSSIIEHGGFYIGRYEAGSETPRRNTSNGTTVMSVKRGKYPYNYVGWGSSNKDYTSTITHNSKDQGHGAVYLSKNLYTDEKKFGVTSTLCYGIQWDAIMKFVEDSEHSISDSSNWGNYYNSTFKFTGKYCANCAISEPKWYSGKNYTKQDGSEILLSTGVSETNKAKNIYDLAGNVEEWTMEFLNQVDKRICRGGSFYDQDILKPASFRDRHAGNVPRCDYMIGFRPALYITETAN